MKKIPWQARQGDVLIERKETTTPMGGLKRVSREDGGVVLAHGEVTGHKHQIRNDGVCELRNESTGERVLVVDVAGLLEHEEHVPPIEIGQGSYEIVQQCEYDWIAEAGHVVQD